jgi:hypothetical protein
LVAGTLKNKDVIVTGFTGEIIGCILGNNFWSRTGLFPERIIILIQVHAAEQPGLVILLFGSIYYI